MRCCLPAPPGRSGVDGRRLMVARDPGAEVDQLLREDPRRAWGRFPARGEAPRTEWTDATKRAQPVNLCNCVVFAMRPQRGLTCTPTVGVASEDRREVELAEWDLVRRAGGDPGPRPGNSLPEVR